jgi:hypothetical protein
MFTPFPGAMLQPAYSRTAGGEIDSLNRASVTPFAADQAQCLSEALDTFSHWLGFDQ